jgi:hypothetical protein
MGDAARRARPLTRFVQAAFRDEPAPSVARTVSLGRFCRRLPVAGVWLVVGVVVTALAGCTREHSVVLGRSADRRPIVAVEISAPRPRATVLVVGCIHGNEPAGVEVARMLRRTGPIPGVDL